MGETKESMSGPSLVFYHEEDGKCSQTIVGLNESGFSVRDVPEIENVENCWPSPQGWVLMHGQDSPCCFLLNPATLDKLPLPHLNLEDVESCWDHRLILSSSPNNPDCVVMLADFKNQRVHFCSLGSERSWISHDCNNDLGEEDTLSNVIGLDGKFYGITLRDNLVLIHTAPCPETSLVKVEKPELLPGICACVHSMVESCGDIFLVVRNLLLGSRTEAGIGIYKMDFEKKAWEPVSDIGDRVFFVGGHCSVSCSASKQGLKGNCIYYVEGSDLCTVDMDEGTVMVDRPWPCANLSDSCFSPFWILPPAV